jgi:hypothetical protein
VAKEPGNVAQPIVVVSVDRLVVLSEGLGEEIGPKAVDLGKAFADETEELGVRLLLAAAFHHHGRQLVLLASWEVDLHELVDGFLGVHGALDSARILVSLPLGGIRY